MNWIDAIPGEPAHALMVAMKTLTVLKTKFELPGIVFPPAYCPSWPVKDRSCSYGNSGGGGRSKYGGAGFCEQSDEPAELFVPMVHSFCVGVVDPALHQ